MSNDNECTGPVESPGVSDAAIDDQPGFASALFRVPLDLWRNRDLLIILTVRQIKIKYGRSWFGLLWTLLNPLMTIGILLIVFVNFVRLPITDYWAFLLSGYFVFHCVSQSLTLSANIPSEYSGMYQNAAFPQEIPMLAGLAARFLEFLIEFLFAACLIVLLHLHDLPASLLWLPLLLVVQALLIMGLSLPLTVVSVFFYDLRYMLPAVLMALFYITPVFYSTQFVPPAYLPLYYLNPLAGMLHGYHTILHGGASPALWLMAFWTLYALLIFVAGYAVFNRFRAAFAEVI